MILSRLQLKFIYSKKAAKFCEIFTLPLTTVHTVKSKVKISQNFVTFSEYMNFTSNIKSQIVPCTRFFYPPKKHEDTLKCLIKVPGQISAQVGKFSKINNRTHSALQRTCVIARTIL